MLLWAKERVICERVQAALTWCKAWRYFGISEILYGSHRKMYTVEILKSAFTVRFPSRLTFHTWRFARCCVCSSLWQGFMSCLNPHIYLALFSAQWSFWANVRENVASNMGALFSHTKFQNILQSSFLLLLFDLAVVIHPFCLVRVIAINKRGCGFLLLRGRTRILLFCSSAAVLGFHLKSLQFTCCVTKSRFEWVVIIMNMIKG